MSVQILQNLIESISYFHETFEYQHTYSSTLYYEEYYWLNITTTVLEKEILMEIEVLVILVVAHMT